MLFFYSVHDYFYFNLLIITRRWLNNNYIGMRMDMSIIIYTFLLERKGKKSKNMWLNSLMVRIYTKMRKYLRILGKKQWWEDIITWQKSCIDMNKLITKILLLSSIRLNIITRWKVPFKVLYNQTYQVLFKEYIRLIRRLRRYSRNNSIFNFQKGIIEVCPKKDP